MAGGPPGLNGGTDYLARIEPLLDALEQANQAARGTSELRGTLRVGLPLSIALRLVIPHLPAFMDPHPALRVDLLMEDRRQDLLRDGIDVALRVGELVDDSAVTRVVGVNERLLAASPAYLARAGTPSSPAQLSTHALIIGTPATLASAWTFERAGNTESVRVEPRMTASVNEAATAAAVAGLGIISNGKWGCGAELAAGTLVRVLPEWKLRSGELHAVFPAGPRRQAVRTSLRGLLAHSDAVARRSKIMGSLSPLLRRAQHAIAEPSDYVTSRRGRRFVVPIPLRRYFELVQAPSPSWAASVETTPRQADR